MATINSFEQIQKIPGLESKVDGDRSVTKEPTGFTNNKDIVVSYDSANRTVTLTGTFTAYYRGEVVTALVDGWVSPAHDAAVGTYFLRYNGTTFLWDNLGTVVFDDLLISYVVVTATTTFALREVHGLMPHDSHRHAHETVGTYVRSGGDLSAFTLNSETATNRRPQISATTVVDEDLDSVLDALSTNAYGWLYLSGANTANITVDNTEIVATSGTAYWNQFTGGNWVQTLLSNNEYAKIFVIAVPTANDVTSIKKRYLFVQPQTASTSLSTIQALGPTTVNFGDLTGLLPEFAFIAEIIIRRNGGGNDWRLIEVNKLTGTKYLQNASPAGAYLSSVATDGTTITGNGTPGDPLLVARGAPVGTIVPWIGGYFGDGSNGTFTNVLANTVANVNALLNSTGWYVCDGAALNDSSSPIFNGASRYLPNLTDERFLQGNTTAGGIGGSNTMLDHTHTHSLTTATHTHTLSGISSAGSAHSHGHTLSTASNGSHSHRTVASGGPPGTGMQWGANNFNHNVETSTDGSHTHTISGSISNESGHTHGVGSYAISAGSALAVSGSVGTGSAATSTNNRPKYLSVFYIMKVK